MASKIQSAGEAVAATSSANTNLPSPIQAALAASFSSPDMPLRASIAYDAVCEIEPLVCDLRERLAGYFSHHGDYASSRLEPVLAMYLDRIEKLSQAAIATLGGDQAPEEVERETFGRSLSPTNTSTCQGALHAHDGASHG